MAVQRVVSLLSCMCLVSLSVNASVAKDHPLARGEKANHLPDFSQKTLPHRNMCGPAAVSNVLASFASNREVPVFPPAPELIARYESADPQFALAQLLGEREYMSTVRNDGTNHFRLINGIARYLDQQGISQFQLTFIGYREFNPRFIDERYADRIRFQQVLPTVDLLREQLRPERGLVILWGAYERGEEPNRLQRVGGHYVTLTQIGVGPDGTPQPDVIAMHDPNDGYEGQKYVQAVVHEQPLTLVTNNGNRETLELSGVLELKGAGNHHPERPCLVDGVFVIDIPQ